ncbi:MAG: hypothetical protein JSV91_01390 [Phycisphaerales bacterium]|nr:MAG: hypothetical protein JSV91_01390 [Phycisphaerales bacterium]
MAITTTIARSYALRMNIIAIVCVVLGAWGIYDYAVAIPNQEKAYAEYHVLELAKDALEAELDDPEYGRKRQDALAIVTDNLDAMILEASLDLEVQIRSVADPQQQLWVLALSAYSHEGSELSEQMEAQEATQEARRIVEVLKSGPEREYEWFRQLLRINMGLRQPPQRPLVGLAQQAYELSQTRLEGMGSRKKPGAYDRWIKGLLFVPCLPAAAYIWWLFFKAKGRTYRLDDDGTLHMPEGTWAQDEIADIDMHRWMAKSIAYVVHTDGTRIKLDDYLYRDLHLIIGSIASGLYPDDWTEEAKPVEVEEEEEVDDALAEEALAAADEPEGEGEACDGDEDLDEKPQEEPDRA